MRRVLELTRRLRSLDTLHDAISAMRSLAAHHFREARAALEPARVYREGMEQMLQSTGASLPAGDGPRGLLVIGAELGLCGGYNAQITEAVAERRGALGEGPISCLGRRAATLLARRGVRVDRSYAAPTGVRGITEVLLGVTQDILSDYVVQRMSRFEVVSSRFAGVGSHGPTITQLLPIETQPSGNAPAVRYASAGRAAGVAVRELLYITMYSLLLEALAAEHGARLAATQSAERWLEERTGRLRRRLSAARREASTQEIIEIAASARARRG